MATLQSAISVPASPSVVATNGDATRNQNSLFFDLKSLTFTGSTAVAGLLVGFLVGWLGIPEFRILVALGVAVLFGIGITLLAIFNDEQVGGTRVVVQAVILGVFNTFVLWVSISGVAVVTGQALTP